MPTNETPAPPSPEVAAVLSNPVALAERKKLKQKLRQCKVAHRAKHGILRQHIQEFKQETAPLIQEIRAIRAAHVEAVSGSEEIKLARSAYATLRYAYTTFKRKYALSRSDMRDLGIQFFPWQYCTRTGVRSFPLKV